MKYLFIGSAVLMGLVSAGLAYHGVSGWGWFVFLSFIFILGSDGKSD